MKRAQHGLTLIEIAIALALAIFLFAIGIPAYHARVTREVVAEVIDLAAPAKALVQDFAAQHGRLPATEDIALPFITSKYVAGTAWAATGSRTGTVTMSTHASGGDDVLEAKAIVLTATYDPGTRQIEWVCGGTAATTVPGRYLPSGCGAL